MNNLKYLNRTGRVKQNKFHYFFRLIIFTFSIRSYAQDVYANPKNLTLSNDEYPQIKQQKENVSANEHSFEMSVDIVQQRNLQPPNCTIPTSNTLYAIQLSNCLSSELYAIPIWIGSPPQLVYVQLDTGSNLLWVSTNIANFQYGFNPNQSSTYKNSSVQYSESYINGGSANGWFGSDFVTIFNTSINVSMSIGFVDRISGLSLPVGVIGVMGVGNTNPQTQPNFLDLAYQQNQIATNTFALQLRNQSLNSLLYYNQLSPNIKSNTLQSPVPPDSFYWQLTLIGVMAGLNDLTSYAAQVAIIDSGTSLFYLNPSLSEAFISAYLPKESCNFTDGLNICNCSIVPTLPNITFIFPGVAVDLEPSDYVQCFNCTCYVHIYQVDTNPPEVLLGDTLFNKYNITFSKQQSKIGFMGPTQLVYGFGLQSYFVTAQWALMGISYAWLFLLVLGFIIAVLYDWKLKKAKLPKENVIDLNESYMKQRITEMIAVDKQK